VIISDVLIKMEQKKTGDNNKAERVKNEKRRKNADKQLKYRPLKHPKITFKNPQNNYNFIFVVNKIWNTAAINNQDPYVVVI